MGYRSDVRLITKKSTIEIFEQANEEIKEIIEYADINNNYGILVYLGWDNIKNDIVDTILDALYDLEDKNLSYRLSIIGENIEDIEEREYTSKEDKSLYIPYPSIIRTFDEKNLVRQMNFFLNDYEKSQKEEIDYE